MGRTIDLDMAIDAIATHKEALLGEADGSNVFKRGYALAHRHICELISVLPSVQPEQKVGKWIVMDDDRISGRCSVCGWEAHMYEDDVVGMDYCPNCGAKMEE